MKVITVHNEGLLGKNASELKWFEWLCIPVMHLLSRHLQSHLSPYIFRVEIPQARFSVRGGEGLCMNDFFLSFFCVCQSYEWELSPFTTAARLSTNTGWRNGRYFQGRSGCHWCKVFNLPSVNEVANKRWAFLTKKSRKQAVTRILTLYLLLLWHLNI